MTAKQNKKMTHIVTWQIESKWAQTSLQMFISQTIWSPATSKWWKLASTVSGSGSCDDPFNTGSLRLSCNTYYITEGCQLAPCIAHANMKGDTYIYIYIYMWASGKPGNPWISAHSLCNSQDYRIPVCVCCDLSHYHLHWLCICCVTCTGKTETISDIHSSVWWFQGKNWENVSDEDSHQLSRLSIEIINNRQMY